MSELPAAAARGPRVSRTVVLAGAGLAAIAIIGVFLVLAFVSDQRERDLRVWQTRMGMFSYNLFSSFPPFLLPSFFSFLSFLNLFYI